MRLRKKKGVAEKLLNFSFVLNGLNESFKGHWISFFNPPAHPQQASPLADQLQQASLLTDQLQQASPLAAQSQQASPLTAQPFEETKKIYLELGIGKGDFISELANRNPNINFIGLEAEPTVLYAAARKVRDLDLKNVRLAAFNVANIDSIFDDDEVDRIYINFCDPWPRNKHAKRRLTNINFLNKYRHIIKSGGELHFKTDNRPLFDYSLEQFALLNLTVDNVTFDLHADQPLDNIQTEYERKFSALGVPINRCVVHF